MPDNGCGYQELLRCTGPGILDQSIPVTLNFLIPSSSETSSRNELYIGVERGKTQVNELFLGDGASSAVFRVCRPDSENPDRRIGGQGFAVAIYD